MKKVILATVASALAITGWAGHHEEGEQDAAMSADAAAAMQAAATPGDSHANLAKSVGKFKASMSMFMAPGAEPMQSTMLVEREMDLDGRVLAEVWQGSVMGAPFQGRSRTGYDNVTKRYWSTWSDNMSTGLLVMYGNWDESAQAIVFTGTGNHPVTGASYSMRSVGKHHEDGSESMTMYEDHGAGEYKTMSFTLERI
ncbi:MAG: DUF1579 family protein [Woeseiaceae bacterium]